MRAQSTAISLRVPLVLALLALPPALLQACSSTDATLPALPHASQGGSSPAGCTAKADCSGDEYCKDGQCLSCSCAPGEQCTADGSCVPEESCPGGCGEGQFCSAAGECIAAGTCKVDADCDQGSGLACDLQIGQCVPGGSCGEQQFEITAQPPNMMIVLDRTGSMDKGVPNTGKSRWEVASEAVAKVLADFSVKIKFGLVVFSACKSGGCAPGVINNPIGSSAADINKTIANTNLCDSGDPETVIGGTLKKLQGEPTLQEAGRDNVVLLITDGQDNCGGGGAKAAADLLAQPVPVPVYVVGFSGDVNAGELTAIATAAGTAPYYQADSPDELQQALAGIAAGVASCTFKLAAQPPGDKLWVFFNKDPNPVPSDPKDGWTYDPATNTLSFHGAACEKLKSGQVTDIDVIFACTQPTPE
ncbi:MAG: VWA domain-containing protein [Deltaproteobacteria bacterium]|nr:VWA domain-containing protein [Deltaproteobacteria bacterium]